MSVTADVIDYLLRARERTLGIDHPFLFLDRSQVVGKSLPMAQLGKGRKETQLTVFKDLVQALQEQAAEQTGEYTNGQEEPRPTSNQPFAVSGEASTGGDHMQMRMMKKILTPGVEHGEETNLSTQMFGISSNGT